jgi:cation transport regulator ChaC
VNTQWERGLLESPGEVATLEGTGLCSFSYVTTKSTYHFHAGHDKKDCQGLAFVPRED